MKLFIFFLAPFFLNFGSQAFAAESVQLTLIRKFSYQDIDLFCNPTQINYAIAEKLFLKILIENGQVISGLLRSPTSGQTLHFSTKEIQAIEIGKDFAGRIWVTSLSLNSRQLDWIFRQSSTTVLCAPPKKLQTLSPSPFTYIFDLADIIEARPPAIKSSSLGQFSGKRVDGHLYSARLRLIQERTR